VAAKTLSSIIGGGIGNNNQMRAVLSHRAKACTGNRTQNCRNAGRADPVQGVAADNVQSVLKYHAAALRKFSERQLIRDSFGAIKDELTLFLALLDPAID